MRRILISALTLGLAIAPATLNGQQPVPGRAHRHAGLAANPAARVLALPSVLELTPAQVAQLEQIRDRTNAQNQPLLAQLQAARPERQRGELRGQRQEQPVDVEARRAQIQARRAELQARHEQLKPVLEQLRQNAQKTRSEVESVLTSEQVAKLRELQGVRGRGGERGARGPRSHR